MTTQTLNPRTEFDPNSWPCPHSGCGVVTSGVPALISAHLDEHRQVDAARRAAALRSVSTLSAALREVIDLDAEHGRAALLSELPTAEITAVIAPVAELLGLLASIEAARQPRRASATAPEPS